MYFYKFSKENNQKKYLVMDKKSTCHIFWLRVLGGLGESTGVAAALILLVEGKEDGL